jgi:hypothetical protein
MFARSFCGAVVFLGLAASVGFAQDTVLLPVGQDVSKPLRDIPPTSGRSNYRLHEIMPIPHGSTGGVDTALQTTTSTLRVPTTSGLSFDGVGISTGYAVNSEPPDTNGSVGTTQFAQWVNTAFAIYDKGTGARVYGPAGGNTIWSGFVGGNCATNNDGDPIVLFDKQAQRWIFTQFSVTGGAPYFQCVAISKTADATGAYNRYAYSFGSNFPDYPKVGVWTDGYYFTFNLFFHASRFVGADMCALDRTTALAGGAAKMICRQTSRSFGGILPADIDGASGAVGTTMLPPAGTPEYFVSFGTNSLNVWRATPNFAAGTISVTGPTNLPVAAFTEACNGGACIPQAATNQQLDSLADRLMYRLAYRNFGLSASLVVNHSVATTAGPTGVRWYELRDSGAGPTVFQQGTFAPGDGLYRWMGSAAMDKLGNMAIGYSVSNGSTFPSIRFAARAATDPAGTLSSELTIWNGSGSQSGHSRWGDYSSISVDPTDDCTMWYTTEYLNRSGDFIWSTHVQSFKLGVCQ